jgi:hypothetical protein
MQSSRSSLHFAFATAVVLSSNHDGTWPVRVVPLYSLTSFDVGDTVAVAAEFSSDSAMTVSCGIGFRRGQVVIDEPALSSRPAEGLISPPQEGPLGQKVTLCHTYRRQP